VTGELGQCTVFLNVVVFRSGKAEEELKVVCTVQLIHF